MDKPISEGDLVVVVRACCESQVRWLGLTFKAIAFTPKNANGPSWCCRTFASGPYFTDSVHDGGWAANYLKRIPPLDELESTDERKEVCA